MTKQITIELSDKAYERLQEIAEIKEETIEESAFNYNKDWLNNVSNEKFQKRLEEYRKQTNRKKEADFYEKYPPQCYILKTFANKNEIAMGWRMGKYPEYLTHPNLQEYKGYYYVWLEKRKTSKSAYGTMFKKVETIWEKKFKFKTLKAMKKKINSLFREYGFTDKYLVK